MSSANTAALFRCAREGGQIGRKCHHVLVEAVAGAWAIRSNTQADVAFVALEGSKAGLNSVKSGAPAAAELLRLAVLPW